MTAEQLRELHIKSSMLGIESYIINSENYGLLASSRKQEDNTMLLLVDDEYDTHITLMIADEIDVRNMNCDLNDSSDIKRYSIEQLLLDKLGDSYKIGYPDYELAVIGGNLTRTDYLFYETATYIIDLTGFNFKSVVSMEYMFAATSVDKIILPKLDSGIIKSIRGMFNFATVPFMSDLCINIDATSLTDASMMFANTEIMTDIKIEFEGNCKLRDISRMFCNALIHNSVDITSLDIDEHSDASDIVRKSAFVDENRSNITISNTLYNKIKHLLTDIDNLKSGNTYKLYKDWSDR